MKKDPWFRNRLIRDAIYKAIHERMQQDPTVYILGEGSHMKVHYDAPEIERDFPGRFMTMPISEDANTNFAVGMAIAGLTPIVDVISSDFLFRTMDGICNTAAKLGTVQEPKTIIIRAEFLTGGPTSGQRIEGLFTKIPGLRVVVPSSPRDAYWLMREALDLKAVTLFFEDRMIPDDEIPAYNAASVIDGGYSAIEGWGGGYPRIRQEGKDVTIVSYGLCLHRIMNFLATVDADVIDLRVLRPLEIEAVLASVSKTGKLLVVEPTDSGVGAQVAAEVAELAPKVRIMRVSGPDRVIPTNRSLHDGVLPTMENIVAAVERLSP